VGEAGDCRVRFGEHPLVAGGTPSGDTDLLARIPLRAGDRLSLVAKVPL
jgi:hypothetical protein